YVRPGTRRDLLSFPTRRSSDLETARGGLLRAGLGYSGPDVSCCLNVSADHLGLRGVHTLEQLAEVKRIPIEVTRDTVVLNADDRSEEHTSELQSRENLVCRLLL